MQLKISTTIGAQEARRQLIGAEEENHIDLSLQVRRDSNDTEIREVVGTLEKWIREQEDKQTEVNLNRQILIFFERGAEQHVDSLMSLYQLLNKLSMLITIYVYPNEDNILEKLQRLIEEDVLFSHLALFHSEGATHSREAVHGLSEVIKEKTPEVIIAINISHGNGEETGLEHLVNASTDPLSVLSILSAEISRTALHRFQHSIERIEFGIDNTRETLGYFPNRILISLKARVEAFEEFVRSIALPETLGSISFSKLDQSQKDVVLDILPGLLQDFPRVYEVVFEDQVRNTIHLKNLNNQGRQLHETYLVPAVGKRLDFLIKNRGDGNYNRGKVMVLGQGGAGKTSTFRSISGQKFNPRHDKTLVADKLDIIDTRGDTFQVIGDKQEGFIGDLAAMSAAAFEKPIRLASNEERIERRLELSPEQILSRGAADNERPKKKQQVVNEAKTRGPLSALQRFLPGGKGKKEVELIEVPKVITRTDSMRNNAFRNLENPVKYSWWDFGGQRVFDAVHSLYLTDGGILLYVFSLKRLVKNENLTLGRIRKWLVSIQLYSQNCQVLFIGTHANHKSVKNKLIEASRAIERLQNKFENVVCVYPDEELSFFPIENSLTKNNYLAPIKRQIKRISTNPESRMTWTAKVELSWMFFMFTVYSGEKNVVSFSDFCEEARGAGFSREEASRMIDFFSSAGEILDYRESLDNSSKASIVMRPRWLLKVLSVILCCREESFKSSLRAIGRENKDGTPRLIVLLNDSGILSGSLLKKLLVRECDIQEDEFELVIKVCERNLIMARIRDLPKELRVGIKIEETESYWLVPSFFVREEDETEKQYQKKVFSINKLFSNRKANKTRKVVWTDLAPQSLFGKFVCGVIQAGRKLDKSYFEVSYLSAEVLHCSLEQNNFKVLVKKASLYLVELYSNDAGFIEDVKSIMRKAYRSVQRLEIVGGKVAEEDCEYYQHTLESSTEGSKSEDGQQSMKWDAFLSHTWAKGNHEKVVEIAALLRQEGITVWLDDKNLKGHMAGAMINGINRSYVFLAFITKEYLKAANNPNSNAGKEFNFAAQIGVEYIVPVVLDPELLNQRTWKDSTVLLHLAQTLYIDFSSPKKIRENMDNLLRRIKETKEQRGA